MPAKLKRDDLFYPKLSYEIIGCSFDVANQLGAGHHEKYYQRALDEAFASKKISARSQVYYPLTFHGKLVGKNFVDFVVDGKIVVEIKKGNRFSKKHIDQVLAYLKLSGLKLAILINFGSNEVSFRRVVNFDS